MFCKPNKYSKVLAVYSVICFLLLQIAGYVTRQIVPQSKKFLPLCLWPCAIHRRKQLSNNVPVGPKVPGQLSVAGEVVPGAEIWLSLSPRVLVLA